MTITLNSYRDLKNVSSEDEMAYKGLWSRWHRFDANGVKYIRKFQINETPNPLIEEGFTQWFRGTGPLDQQHYDKVATALRNLSLGKPKSDETKSKMRQAKLGKPKSDQHRKNMSLAQRRRFGKNNEPIPVQQKGPSNTHITHVA